MACPMRPAMAVGLLILRLGLGGLMAFSGWMKLGLHSALGLQAVLPLKSLTPQDFVFAIKAFQLGLPDEVLLVLAFVVPWVELLAGLAVVLGVWARSGAVLIAALMVGFGAGIASLMVRGLDVTCPCFGALKLICTGPMGSCHLIRNACFLAAAGLVVWVGPGAWALWDGRARACGLKSGRENAAGL